MFLLVPAHPDCPGQIPQSRKMVVCVCVFGTLKQCFVLNTPVNFILNKFVTPVVPPSDKINNSVFYLQYQARLLHSNAYIFKITIPICTIFGIIEHCDIINMSVTSFSSLSKFYL